MKLVLVYFNANILELIRMPGYWVPTIGIPVALFLFFGVPNATDQKTASFFMVAYATWGILAVAFFNFGVFIAVDRESPWEIYLRTLPVSPQVRFSARVLVALAFEVATILVVFIEAIILTPVKLEIGNWCYLFVALLIGSIPLCLLGIALGYWASAKTATPIANLLWIFLGYAGGMWGKPFYPISIFSQYLPTWLFIEATWPFALERPWQPKVWFELLGYLGLGGLLAIWGYRRDEGKKYR